MQRSDEALLAAHCQGDNTAFGEIVSRHADSLLGYLRRMCRDHQIAEDLFQETFRRVHQKADTFEGKSKFRTWMYRIAANLTIDRIRKINREPDVISLNSNNNDCGGSGCPLEAAIQPAGRSAVGPLETAILAEQKKQVKAAIEKLPAGQRTALVLTYYQGLSYREAAEILDCSLGTVKSHMFRALKSLAKLLPDVKGGVH